MSSAPPPIPPSDYPPPPGAGGDAPAIFQRWGISGMLLAIGGLVGLIVCFLPAVTISIFGASATVMVVQGWQGKLGLLAYIAAIVFAFLLYPPGGPRKNPLTWAAVGAGGLAVLMALLMFIEVNNITSGSAVPGAAGAMLKAGGSVGIGTYLNFLTAGAVLAGGILKAREERLF
ncbi:MAG: hypothetical protein K2W96_01920 [Gemmataceae bacterium]|nr:hypothetical protein [Gemmataceae bacterium]